MYLPKDPAMLLSWVNTKLRDEASSFSALCEEYELDMAQIEASLSAIGYHYDAAQNRFR